MGQRGPREGRPCEGCCGALRLNVGREERLVRLGVRTMPSQCDRTWKCILVGLR
jgi:hypothetical protein